MQVFHLGIRVYSLCPSSFRKKSLFRISGLPSSHKTVGYLKTLGEKGNKLENYDI